jgi:hypothetical protein
MSDRLFAETVFKLLDSRDRRRMTVAVVSEFLIVAAR